MPVRMLTYSGLLYQALIDQKVVTEKGGLPALIPMVLYNGNERWRGDTELSIPHCPEALRKYLPQLRLWLIDEKGYRDHPLEVQNLVSAIFALENIDKLEDLQTVAEAFRTVFEKHPHSTQEISQWIRWSLAQQYKIDLPPNFALTQGTNMLADTLKRLYDEGQAEATLRGRQEGINQGISEGIQQGERLRAQVTVRKLILKKFKVLPIDLEAKIEAASLEQTEVWLENILDAQTLEAVFSV
jgi:hypothetical protein